jgi:ABC-type multidrug transport system ATPase subunit
MNGIHKVTGSIPVNSTNIINTIKFIIFNCFYGLFLDDIVFMGYLMKDLFIKLIDIKKEYQSKDKIFKALKGISLDIFKGQIIFILGVNGAGETTLSSIIATLCPPTSGEILWNNESIYENIIEYQKIIGFCPQKPYLDPMLTLEENLTFSGYLYGMNGKDTKTPITSKYYEEAKKKIKNYIN